MMTEISTRNHAQPCSIAGAVIIVFALLSITMSAQANDFSGFLDDYSGLEEVHDRVFTATVPDLDIRIAQYDAIMIDQPEVMLDEDSRHEKLKPDEIKLIADTLRVAMIKKFEHSSYRLVSTPAPGTLYVRIGLTEVGLKKKKMRLVQFTPIGLAATIATSPLRDIMDKLVLKRFTFEAELIDAETGEQLGRFVDRSREKKSEGSWDDAMRDLNVASNRFLCRMENPLLPPENRTDCFTEFPFADTDE